MKGDNLLETMPAKKRQPAVKNKAERISKMMQSQFFAQNPDAVFAFNLQGNFLSVNNAFVTLVQCPHEEALGRNFLDFLPGEEKERVMGYFKRAAGGETLRYETKVITAKGKLIFLHVLKFPIIVHDEVIGVYAIARDITKQKFEEDKLRQSEDKFRSIIENAQIGFFLTAPDQTTQVLDANKAGLDMFGYTLDEIRKLNRKDMLDFDSPDTLAQFEERLRRGHATGEITGIRKNGERFLCDFSSVLFRDINGELRTSSNIIDISERKAAEKELHHRQELLNAIINNAGEGIAVADLNGHFIIFNRSMTELLGVEKTDSDEYDWSNIFHIRYPDTGQPVPKNALPIIRAMGGEEVKDEVLLIQNPKKGDVYISVSSSAIRDSTGKIVASMVIDRDITAQINYERELIRAIDKLEESNHRFRLATKASYDAIWDWDTNSSMLYLGEGFRTIFGYDINGEVPVETWFAHIHPDHIDRIRASIETALADPACDKWDADFLFRRADGTYAYVFDKGLILRNDKGEPTRMIGAIQDVTEHQKNLLAIKTQNAKLLQIAWAQSHLLRAPVCRIMGISSLLGEPSTDKKTAKKLIEYLDTSVKELDEIIIDIIKNAEGLNESSAPAPPQTEEDPLR